MKENVVSMLLLGKIFWTAVVVDIIGLITMSIAIKIDSNGTCWVRWILWVLSSVTILGCVIAKIWGL
jgi:hypothetical protein